MFSSILAGRAPHIPLEYLPVVCGGGETYCACNLCNTFSFHQKRKAVLDSQEENIIEDCHLHIFLEKTAAFALADIYMVCDIIKSQFLRVIILYESQNIF